MESNPELRKRLQEILSGDPATQDVILSLIQAERLAAATKVRDAVMEAHRRMAADHKSVEIVPVMLKAASAICDEIGRGNN